MTEYDTGVSCPSCKEGKIVGETRYIPEPFTMSTPIGPGWGGGGRTEISFHCSNCQIVFNHPPGKPNARDDIWKKLGEARREEEGRKFGEMVKRSQESHDLRDKLNKP